MAKGVEKGTRLPADWQPSTDLFQWAQAERPEIPAKDLHKITEDFKDYWLAEAGKRAYKLDWDRTYRRWIRHHFVRKQTGFTKDNTPKGFVC